MRLVSSVSAAYIFAKKSTLIRFRRHGKPRNIPINLPILKHHNRIALKITEIDSGSFGSDVRMFLQQQPANVREEKSATIVMRIGIGVGELMMNAMITSPNIYTVKE